MENYIVRIYRRDSEDPQQVAGVVELVEPGKTKAFSCIEELNQILRAETNMDYRDKVKDHK